MVHGYRLSDMIRETDLLWNFISTDEKNHWTIKVKGRKDIEMCSHQRFFWRILAEFDLILSSYWESNHHSTNSLRWDHVSRKKSGGGKRLSIHIINPFNIWGVKRWAYWGFTRGSDCVLGSRVPGYSIRSGVCSSNQGGCRFQIIEVVGQYL